MKVVYQLINDIIGSINLFNTPVNFHINDSVAEEILNPIRYPAITTIQNRTYRQVPEINPRSNTLQHIQV